MLSFSILCHCCEKSKVMNWLGPEAILLGNVVYFMSFIGEMTQVEGY